MPTEPLRALGVPLRVQQVPLEGPPVSLQETTSRPSIRLWLLGTEIDLNARCRELMAIEQAPFWAFCWAGGQALARLVTQEPHWVRGKHVVDFGAGSGIAGIAAALAGARRVTAVDTDPEALEACTRNAALNGVTLETAATLCESADVVLAADVLYDDPGRKLLAELRSHPGRVLLADPGRPSSPDLPERPVASYALTTIPDVDPPMRQASVYVLTAGRR